MRTLGLLQHCMIRSLNSTLSAFRSNMSPWSFLQSTLNTFAPVPPRCIVHVHTEDTLTRESSKNVNWPRDVFQEYRKNALAMSCRVTPALRMCGSKDVCLPAIVSGTKLNINFFNPVTRIWTCFLLARNAQSSKPQEIWTAPKRKLKFCRNLAVRDTSLGLRRTRA